MDEQYPVPYEERPYPAHQQVNHPADRAVFDWDDGDEETTSLGDHLLAMYRYKWMIAVATVLGVVAAVATWNIVEQRPTYTAQGSMWVQVGGTQPNAGPIQADGLLPAASYLELLRSFTILESVVLEQNLYLRPADPADLAYFSGIELTGDRVVPGTYAVRVADGGTEIVQDDEVVEFARAGQPIGASLGIRWMPPRELPDSRAIGFFLTTPRGAAGALRETLQTSVDQRGGFITLALTGPDPERVAAVVNAVMDRHVRLAEELKTISLQEEYETLEEQLEFARLELEAAESALESFRVATVTLPSDQPIQAGLEMTRGPVFDEFFQKQMRREEVSRDRQRLEAAAADLDAGAARVEALEIIPSVGGSAEFQEALGSLVAARAERRTLLERYTEEHPSVQAVDARISALEDNQVPRLISQLVQQLRVEEDLLSEEIDASGVELSRIPARAIEEAQLRRRAELAAAFYSDIQRRFQVASLTRASAVPDVSILDRAVPPESPSGGVPRLPLTLGVFAAFVGLGIAGAIVRARFDSRLRTPDEVSTTFGMNILATIPRIERRNGQGTTTIKNIGHMHEAFRELRTNLVFAYGSAGSIVATVTSSGMSEGKTTITTNLGVSFAELGKRTLLIDADTRRGDMHQYFNGHRKPGLTDYLRGDVELAAVLQSSPHMGLDFIGSGRQYSNSPELLSSGAMGRLMGWARRTYDVILVDSPPLGAGADPLVLATITGHLILVIRSGSTDREFTLAKMEPMSRLPVRSLGAVVNEYEPSRLEGYTYYSSYLPGYEAGAEEESGWASPGGDSGGGPASLGSGVEPEGVGSVRGGGGTGTGSG